MEGESSMSSLLANKGSEICTDEFFESEEEEMLGQVHAWNCTFAFIESLAVKSAVLLEIPDIIARQGPGATLSLSEIAARLPRESPDVSCLFRIMRFLVAKGVFRAEDGGSFQTRYGLTPISKWFVKKREISMVPMLLMQNDERIMAPWHYLNKCVLDGALPFQRAHGADIWSYASAHPDFNHLFNNAMAGDTRIVMKTLVSKYQGFHFLNSLVDVGGGTGTALAEIVRAYPSIKAINYDLPHVITTAQNLPGVEHVGGDMFETVPAADAILMKWIMHDWSDEDCSKILRNCRKAIPETGKVIIVDMVADFQHNNEKKGAPLDPNLCLVFDLLMATHCTGGKERTEEEWKKILWEGGFGDYNIVGIPALQSVIEAFPR